MKSSKIVATVFWLLPIILGLLIFSAPLELAEKLNMVQIFAVTLLLTGGTILFWMHLRHFQRKLRRAYTLICLGLLLVVAGAWQFAIIGIMGAMDSWWVDTSLAELPFLVATILTYCGVRILAKLVGVQSLLLGPGYVALCTIGGGVFSVALATLIGLSDPSGYLMSVMQAFIALSAALLVRQARAVTSVTYAPAFTWLMRYCLVTVAAGALTFATAGLPADHWYVVYSAGNALFILNGVFIMLSAYAFAKVATAERLPQDSKKTANRQAERSVDIVVFLAKLASNPTAVDTILDPMRSLTSALAPNAPLTVDQQNIMASVYLALEDHLVTKEPLRSYNKEDLRQMLELRFKDTVNEPAFWESVLLRAS